MSSVVVFHCPSVFRAETKHVIKKLTTHVTVTVEVLINKTIKIYCYFPLKSHPNELNQTSFYIH